MLYKMLREMLISKSRLVVVVAMCVLEVFFMHCSALVLQVSGSNRQLFTCAAGAIHYTPSVQSLLWAAQPAAPEDHGYSTAARETQGLQEPTVEQESWIGSIKPADVEKGIGEPSGHKEGHVQPQGG